MPPALDFKDRQIGKRLEHNNFVGSQGVPWVKFDAVRVRRSSVFLFSVRSWDPIPGCTH